MTVTRPFVSTNWCWIALADHVLREGQQYTIRGRGVRELIGYQSVWPMRWPLLSIAERSLGYRFAFSEASWICRGSNLLADLPTGREKFSKFSDDGVTLYGAYGISFKEQLNHVVKTLAADIFSRQAVINIWRENPIASRDVPCTLSWQFLVRERNDRFCLDVVSTMRSSDVYLGIPYDVFTLSQVACQVALELAAYEPKTPIPGTDGWKILVPYPGNIYLTAGSQHIYNDDEEKLRNILNKHRRLVQEDERLPRDLPDIEFSFSDISAMAYFPLGHPGDELVLGQFGIRTQNMTTAERHLAWLWLVGAGHFDNAEWLYRWVVSDIKETYAKRGSK